MTELHMTSEMGVVSPRGPLSDGGPEPEGITMPESFSVPIAGTALEVLQRRHTVPHRTLREEKAALVLELRESGYNAALVKMLTPRIMDLACQIIAEDEARTDPGTSHTIRGLYVTAHSGLQREYPAKDRRLRDRIAQ